MKLKSILIAALLLIGVATVAQQPTATATTVKTADPVIKDTTIRGTTYKLYQGKKGGKYIIVVAKTTGKEYKKYFSTTKTDK